MSHDKDNKYTFEMVVNILKDYREMKRRRSNAKFISTKKPAKD